MICSLWFSCHRCWRFSLKSQHRLCCHAALHIGQSWIVERRTFSLCHNRQSIQFWINNRMSHHKMLITANSDCVTFFSIKCCRILVFIGIYQYCTAEYVQSFWNLTLKLWLICENTKIAIFIHVGANNWAKPYQWHGDKTILTIRQVNWNTAWIFNRIESIWLLKCDRTRKMVCYLNSNSKALSKPKSECDVVIIIIVFFL